ncbi:MAG: LexA family transcriptional regulator [Microbacteriaceae bacterium]|nr:LexA family transcriptional regulator [Microbacteriaceae bacterium]
MRNNLKKLRERHGLTQEEFAAQMGTTRNQLVKLESGKRRLSDKWISKAADVLGVDAGELVTSSEEVPVVGFVGAGGQAFLYSENDNPNETVVRPPESPDTTVAAFVRGDSMSGIADDGDIIYWDEQPTAPNDSMYNKLCVIGLTDGRVVVKRLVRGSQPGKWHLLSTTQAPMLDMEVEWASRVTWIRPR